MYVKKTECRTFCKKIFGKCDIRSCGCIEIIIHLFCPLLGFQYFCGSFVPMPHCWAMDEKGIRCES